MSKKMLYQKLILTGKHYDIGKQKGENLKKNYPELIKWLMEVPQLPEYKKGLTPFEEDKAQKRCDLYNKYSFGLGEEVRGLAAGIGVGVHQLNRVLYGYGSKQPGACSIIAASSDKTMDNSAYIGESYEFGYDDEYSFVIQRAEGSYAHMGFAFFQIGCFDGINEKGLCVGITCLDFVVPSAGEKDGFSFSVINRILLDTCSTTQEAIDKIKELPICTNANIIIGDKTGKIVNLEIMTHDNKTSIAIRPADPYVYGFNHFLDDEHKKQFPAKRYFSYAREEYMKKFFEGKEKVSRDELLQALKSKLPNGLCCHAYTFYFGTLRSMFFNVTKSELYVCFGSPHDGEYIKMNLWEEADSLEKNIQVIPVEYNNEIMPENFWEFV